MDLHGFSIIFVDLGRFWGVAGLEGLATCGALWQPVAPSGTEIPPPKQEDSILEASNIKKNRSFDASSLEASGGEEVGE